MPGFSAHSEAVLRGLRDSRFCLSILPPHTFTSATRSCSSSCDTLISTEPVFEAQGPVDSSAPDHRSASDPRLPPLGRGLRAIRSRSREDPPPRIFPLQRPVFRSSRGFNPLPKLRGSLGAAQSPSAQCRAFRFACRIHLFVLACLLAAHQQMLSRPQSPLGWSRPDRRTLNLACSWDSTIHPRSIPQPAKPGRLRRHIRHRESDRQEVHPGRIVSHPYRSHPSPDGGLRLLLLLSVGRTQTS